MLKFAKKLKIFSGQWNPVIEGVEKAPTRTSIFAKLANNVKSAKTFKFRGLRENVEEVGRVPKKTAIFVKIANVVKSAKDYKIRRVSKIL